MKAVTIDFAGHQRMVQFDLASWKDCVLLIIFAVGVVLVAGASIAMWHIGQERKVVNTQIDQLVASARAKDIAATMGPLSPEAISAINEAVTQLNYPWIDILASFEKHANPEVRVVSLELGAARQGAKIIVEAPDVATLLSYLEALRSERSLRGISLVKQEAVTTEGVTATRFTLEVATPEADNQTARRPS